MTLWHLADRHRLGTATGLLWATLVVLWLGSVTRENPGPALHLAGQLTALAALVSTLLVVARLLFPSREQEGAATKGRLAAFACRWVLPILLALALAVRLTGIQHEVEDRYYLDEGTYVHHAQEINEGKLLRWSFVYPHLLYYLDAFFLWLLSLFPWAWAAVARLGFGVEDPLSAQWLALRALTALSSALTVVPGFFLGRRLAGLGGALTAGALVIFCPLFNEGSHLHTSDVPATFFALGCLALTARLLDSERLGDYLLAGAFAGLAAATKYPAGVVAVAIVAVWVRGRIGNPRGSRGYLLLPAAGLAAIFVFAAAMPSMLWVPGEAFFGDRGMLFGARQYGQGGWIGVMPASNAGFYFLRLLEAFGLPALLFGAVGLAALEGHALRRALWLLPFPVLYLFLIGSMNMVVRRNLYPALPALAVFLGAGLAALAALIAARGPRSDPRNALLLGVALVSIALAWPIARTATQAASFVLPGTRQVAAEWLLEHLPPGAGLVKEAYTPNLPPGRLALWQSRFAARIPPEEIRRPPWDFVLLAANAYARFEEEEALVREHHVEYARRYEEIFSTFEPVAEWQPSPWRRGPVLKLLRVPLDPAAAARKRSFSAAEAFVPDGSMRPPREGAPVRFTLPGQWSLVKGSFEAGTYRVRVHGRGLLPGTVRVVDLSNREIAWEPLEAAESETEAPAEASTASDAAVFDGLSLPHAGKAFFYVYLPEGARLLSVEIEPLPS